MVWRVWSIYSCAFFSAFLSEFLCGCRLGQIYVDGDIGNATVAASGSGDVYILGLADTAVLNLAGTMNAYIQGTSGKS